MWPLKVHGWTGVTLLHSQSSFPAKMQKSKLSRQQRGMKKEEEKRGVERSLTENWSGLVLSSTNANILPRLMSLLTPKQVISGPITETTEVYNSPTNDFVYRLKENNYCASGNVVIRLQSFNLSTKGKNPVVHFFFWQSKILSLSVFWIIQRPNML